MGGSQDGFGTGKDQASDIRPACRRKDIQGSLVIDLLKDTFISGPEHGNTRQVVDGRAVLHCLEKSIGSLDISLYRFFGLFRYVGGKGILVKDPDPFTVTDQFTHQVGADKTASSYNKIHFFLSRFFSLKSAPGFPWARNFTSLQARTASDQEPFSGLP